MEKQDSSLEKIHTYLVKNGGLALQIGRRFVFQEFGLSEPKFEVLKLLVESNHPLRLSELSDHLEVSNANITGLVDRLERDGYVERKRDPKDRRAWLAVITTKGIDVYNEVRPRYERALESLFEPIPQEETDQILETLEKLHDHLQEATTGGIKVKVK